MTLRLALVLLPIALLTSACGGGGAPHDPGDSAGASGSSDSGGTGGSSGGSGGSSGTSGAGGSAGSGMVPPEEELVGWAAVAGLGRDTTTGGDGGQTVRPSTAAELVAYGVSPEPLVIELSGNFDVPRLELLSNKTLAGVRGGATINGGIRIRPQSSDETVENVIVRNLRVNGATSAVEGSEGEAPNDDDDAIVIYRAHHVWLDHLEVWDGRDGNLDVVHGSDFVTISWSKFRYSDAAPYEDHRYSNLVGHSDSENAAAEDRGALRVTFHHNWWAERVVERMPRVRFGKVHVFDNYYSSAGNNYCIRAGFESDVLVENNYFDGVGKPHEINEDDGGPGKLTSRENEYVATTGAQDQTGTAFEPPYAYSPDPAADVKTRVMDGAGPR
jgi:pectate lyase